MAVVRKSASRLVILLVLAALCIVSAGAAENATVSVGGSASADGDLTFAFKPEQGEERTISITILKGTNSRNAAREIWKEFVLALGDGYDVTIKGKEKRHVKIASKTPAGAFTLGLTNNTVGGIAISVGE
jgi:hypothetical protein